MKLAKIYVFNTKEKTLKMIVLVLTNVLLSTPCVAVPFKVRIYL